MPSNSVVDAYAEWLATPPTTGLLIETIEIYGKQANSDLCFCNRRSTPLVASDENGMPRTFLPLAFQFTKPAIRNSTEYTSSVRLDGLDGRLLELFANIKSDQLNDPIYVILRTYIDPTMLDRPVWIEPLKFRCEKVKVALDVIELDLVGGRLPTKRAGIYYTMDRFEGLRPF
jgi:hypothetical protein